MWVSSLLPSDSSYYEANRIVSRRFVQGYQILMPPPILIELINVLSKNNISKDKIKKEITLLTNNKNISIPNIENNLLIYAAQELAGRIKLKSQDFYIIVYAYLIKVTEFITFDKAQKISYDYIKKSLT